jgi:hypothetical protein
MSVTTEKQQAVLMTLFSRPLSQVSKDFKGGHSRRGRVLTPGDLCSVLSELWETEYQLKTSTIPLSTMLRSIFVNPKATPPFDFGNFHRVTKDLEGPYSPLFYGGLNNATYISVVDSIGKVPTGVKVLRRIVDHTAAFKHRPSTELADLVVTQCSEGLWPRTLLAFLDYLKTEEVPISTEIWGNFGLSRT